MLVNFISTWTTREWYPVLARGQGLELADDWILYQSGANVVQMVHCSGEMCKAVIEEDRVCRVEVNERFLPFPNEVIDRLKLMLHLD